jgi:AcrR family transcriptional regulator
MDFQRARTEQQVESRHAEILNACAALYEEAGADGVTIKAIAQRTSFSRPSIYNYYDTKEEILLDLLQRECGDYTQELRQGFAAAVRLDRSAFCRLMTDALLRHEKMLRLMSVNLNSIENNVGDQRLLAFKKDMAAMFDELRRGLEKFLKGTKFTMDELAKSLGISKRTLYENIRSKEDLSIFVVERYFEIVEERQRPIREDASLEPVEKLRRLLTTTPTMPLTLLSMDAFRTEYQGLCPAGRKTDQGWENTFSVMDEAVAAGVFAPSTRSFSPGSTPPA